MNYNVEFCYRNEEGLYDTVYPKTLQSNIIDFNIGVTTSYLTYTGTGVYRNNIKVPQDCETLLLFSVLQATKSFPYTEQLIGIKSILNEQTFLFTKVYTENTSFVQVYLLFYYDGFGTIVLISDTKEDYSNEAAYNAVNINYHVNFLYIAK